MKTGALKGKKVLYLDFDGVLHHSYVLAGKGKPAEPILDMPGFRLFQYEQDLVKILPDDVLIVLSTSWANLPFHSTNWAKNWLCPELQERVVGRTGDVWTGPKKFRALDRGHQVLLHARQFKPEHWIALDDDARGFHTCMFNFIQTDWRLGILPVLDRIEEVFKNWSNV